MRQTSPQPKTIDDNKLDDEFVKLMLEVEKQYQILTKHERIRTEQWTKKLCQVTTNILWKKNRNTYARQLLNCIYQRKFVVPFKSVPPEGPLQKFNRCDLQTLCYDISQLIHHSQVVEIQKKYISPHKNQIESDPPIHILEQDNISPLIPEKSLHNDQFYFHESSVKSLQDELQIYKQNEKQLIKQLQFKDEEIENQKNFIQDLKIQNEDLVKSNATTIQLLNEAIKYLKNTSQRKVELQEQYDIDLFLRQTDGYIKSHFGIELNQPKQGYTALPRQEDMNESDYNFQNQIPSKDERDIRKGIFGTENSKMQTSDFKNSNNNKRQISDFKNNEDTQQFLDYLESFQKKTEKLKKETDLLLRKSSEAKNTNTQY